MTNKQHIFRKSLIQKIQIVKHNVFADDESRRDFMLSRFGVDSTTKLSIEQLKLLLDFCNRKVSDIPVSKATEAQVHRIFKLWYTKARNKEIGYLQAFINRIVGKYVLVPNELTQHEATKVLVALEKMK
jgi:hypothetical protein